MAIKNKQKKPIFLLTNDDGYSSPGIMSLAKELKTLGQVYIVAPDKERSSISMALTLRHPLRTEKVAEKVYSVDGTPADCLYIARKYVLPRKPDFLISGMNLGANLGCQDVSYSGTVAAALQGTFMGIPSMAVSLISRNGGKYDFEKAAHLVRLMVEILSKEKLPPKIYLNVNIPPFPIKGLMVTRLGEKRYNPELIKKKDPRGKAYFWIGVGHPKAIGPKNSDVQVVDRGWVSITPLQIDRTAHHLVKGSLFSRLERFFNKTEVLASFNQKQ
ncbi:MAG TPA: 5'/3'-nucleotidase SurE [Candidatus Aminicenantes bacterium]|nr:MAG: 5'/3'-nucleotidase SurE [Candidatus Aminicenantes bacterium]HEK85291.1 5'/3'-nucleotidase SurE [Candidatus Aminicenantes bacterium]